MSNTIRPNAPVLVKHKLSEDNDYPGKSTQKDIAASDDWSIYQTLFELSPAGIMLEDADGFILDANPAVCGSLNCSRTEIIGKNIREFALPEDEEKVAQNIRRILAGEHLSHIVQTRRTDASRCFMELKERRMRLKDGSWAIMVISDDITKRVETEQALLKSESDLRISEEKYKALLESVQDGIFVIEDGLLQYVNEAFARMIGYVQDELILMPISQLCYPDDRQMVMERYRKRLNGEDVPNEYEMRLLHRDDRTGVLVNIHVGLFQFKNRVASIGTVKNISEHREMELRLRQSQKMEAIGRLAGGVAHDFNNLLTVIRGYGKLILSTSEKNNSIYSKVEQIDKAAERAEALTQQLLAFSRRQVLQPKIINLNDQIIEAQKLFIRLIGEDIELRTEFAPDLLNIEADPHQIEQVIMNLAVNARDAMPDGGSLEIKTQNVVFDECWSVADFKIEAGTYVLIKISDNGTGMDDETRNNIFEPFFTTKETGQGTGLGLATVYGIIKQSNGYITVESKSGSGTTFYIYLPAIQAMIATNESEQPIIETIGGNETILVVEDEEEVRSLITEMLGLSGYKVIEADNGLKATEITKDPGLKIDMVLTDVVMPQMGGKEAVACMRDDIPGLRVLYMSGYTDHDVIKLGILEASTQFIQKPFTPIELMHKVREVLDNHE